MYRVATFFSKKHLKTNLSWHGSSQASQSFYGFLNLFIPWKTIADFDKVFVTLVSREKMAGGNADVVLKGLVVQFKSVDSFRQFHP
jgi:hypothetical protein